MKVLALDIATRTGWCVRAVRGEAQYVRCGSYRCEGDGFDQKAGDLGSYLDRLFKVEEPIGYAAIEAPFKVIPMGGGKDLFGARKVPLSTPKTIGLLHALAGSAANSLRRAGIPWRMVAAPEWRKAFVGVTQAPSWAVKGTGTPYLKRIVSDEAARLGKVYGFKIPNHDVGDAVGIAWWLAAHVGRFRAEDALRARHEGGERAA